MDFFEQQERARKRSRWLIVCFAVAMLLKLAFVCVIVGSICQLKRNILLACAHCVAADRSVDVREMELLRAIADTLESPIPPFVEALQQV